MIRFFSLITAILYLLHRPISHLLSLSPLLSSVHPPLQAYRATVS